MGLFYKIHSSFINIWRARYSGEAGIYSLVFGYSKGIGEGTQGHMGGPWEYVRGLHVLTDNRFFRGSRKARPAGILRW
jgi:hypothetical protein